MDSCYAMASITPPPSAGADKDIWLGAPPSSRGLVLPTPLGRQSHQHSHPRSRRPCREQQPTPASFDDDSLASSSPQQEPDSAAYLARLLRLAQCRPGLARRRSHAMADFLASFNLGAQTATPSSNLQCHSVDDLQLHLRSVLDAKTAPNRAEHVSVIMELRATVQFTIAQPQIENHDDEASNNIDPALEGGSSMPAPEEQTREQPPRVVEANEVLVNQPQDDPSLQRLVATHIIEALGAIDGSTWADREMSRGAQAWKFTFVCKNSFQQWSHQHAKHLTKLVVGEYSQREPDATLSSRPAFDCRGTVMIEFDRNSRAIIVKYDHTPLHRTVAELSEYFKPAPRELGPGAQKQQQQKTPKKQKPDKRAQDERGNPRKRKRKTDGDSQPMVPGASIMSPPNYSVAVPENGQTQTAPSYSQDPQPQEASSGQNQQATIDYPEELLRGESVPTTSQSQAQKADSQPPSGASFPVKISPTEAARRREAAMAMLTRAGVPPDSLSADQFSIFSNQSPELQKESLGMLVKYGAERLRIVHPNNKGGASSAQANTSPGRSSLPTPSGPMTTKELVPQGGGSSDADTTNGSAAKAGDDGTAGTTPEPTPTGRRKPGKSRNACFTCKGRKVKCPRERPVCSECTAQGLVCEFAPHIPRKKKPKKTAQDEPAEDGEGDYGEGEADQDDAAPHIPSQEHSSYPQVPDSSIPTLAVGAPTQDHRTSHADYFHPSSGSALTQDEAPSLAHHNITADPGHTYKTISEQIRHLEHHTVPAETNAVPPTHNNWGVGGSASRCRQNFPSEPARSVAQDVPPATNQPSSDWNTSANNGRPAATMASVSPHMTHPTMHQRHQPENRHQPSDSAPGPDGMQAMQQASSWAQAAIQYQHQPPTSSAATITRARASPLQAADAPRAKSRQGHRAQSRTSVGDQTVAGGYQSPYNRTQTRANNSGNHSSDKGGIPKHNDYGRSGTTNTAASKSSQKPGYEPYAQSQAASNLSQIVDPPSRVAKIAMSMSSQASSTVAPSYHTSSSNQRPGSQHKNQPPHSSTSTYQNQNTYSQPSGTKSDSASRQSYNTRGSLQPTRSENNSFSHQQHNYSQYPAPAQPQQQQSQTSNQSNSQHQNWYAFNNPGTSSFTAANQSSGYSWKAPDESW